MKMRLIIIINDEIERKQQARGKGFLIGRDINSGVKTIANLILKEFMFPLG